jgi:hypothetical protein
MKRMIKNSADDIEQEKEDELSNDDKELLHKEIPACVCAAR